MKKGIFWCVDAGTEHPKLITVSADCDSAGGVKSPVEFSSKSGSNFNHKAEWEKLSRTIKNGCAYNHYPRGRVEIKGGRTVIYLNPDINRENILQIIMDTFELRNANGIREIKVKSDGSEHYRYF